MCQSQTKTSLNYVKFDCAGVESRMDDFLDKELSQFERIGVQRHLDNCSSCSSSLNELKDLSVYARQLAATTIPPEVSRRLHDRIALELSSSAQVRRSKLYAVK
jgi:predicted anti-sigma-YlaC factor YlaD